MNELGCCCECKAEGVLVENVQEVEIVQLGVEVREREE